MAKKPTSQPVTLQPIIGAMPQVKLHQIFDEEFKQLAAGGLGQQNDFAFASALLSAGLAFGISLLTTEIKNRFIFDIFCIISFLCLVQGIYFGVRFHRTGNALKDLIRKIEARMPRETVPVQLPGQVFVEVESVDVSSIVQSIEQARPSGGNPDPEM